MDDGDHRRFAGGRLCALLLPAVLLGTPAALAEVSGRPFWTEQAMFRFGGDLFFVGQASCAKTAEEGRQRAFAHGVQELLNYAQVPRPAGIELVTQMVFEEARPPGCPPDTFTVWRLLRVDADKVAKLATGAFRRHTPPPSPAASSHPRDLTPRIGMSRAEVLERFGRPWAISSKDGSEGTWHYPSFGLTLVMDQDDFVKRWRLVGPQGHERKGGQDAEPQGPAADLTPRLKRLEQEPEHDLNVVYNQRSFLPAAPDSISRPAPPVAEEPSQPFSSRPFPPVIRITPSLASPESLSDFLPPGLAILRCDLVPYSLSIRHLANATGPQIVLDERLSDSALTALRTAVTAASKAVGYDPRFLAVRLSLRMSWRYTQTSPSPYNRALDASAAGSALAVAVVSAILGDPMRSDVFLIGSLDQNLEVGPVNDLEGKISACRQPIPIEMILPTAQMSSDFVAERIGEAITLTKVSTLADAYEAATGQPFRRIP